MSTEPDAAWELVRALEMKIDSLAESGTPVLPQELSRVHTAYTALSIGNLNLARAAIDGLGIKPWSKARTVDSFTLEGFREGLEVYKDLLKASGRLP
ncbi:MAG: hypothetical protein ACOY4R_25090 [Pseudomonadota bacterium]